MEMRKTSHFRAHWRLLERSEPFDLAVGMGEEIVDQRIKPVFFEDRDGVAGVGDDPQVGLWDIFGDGDRMQHRDGVVVAADDERGTGDVM